MSAPNTPTGATQAQKSSWGHALTEVTDELRAHWESQSAFWRAKGWGDRYPDSVCSTRGCSADTTHIGTYRYVTGKRGRVTTRRKMMCEIHAAEWAKRNLPAKVTQ